MASIVSLTGAADFASAIGVITALKEKAEKCDALAAQLATVEKEKNDAKVSALLEKVAPAKREAMAKLAADHGVGALEACVGVLGTTVEPAKEPEAKKVESNLGISKSSDFEKILRITGVKAEDFSQMAKKISAKREQQMKEGD
jgi:phosphodiesterase/alkaline phosphatase D-like protein